MVYSKSYKKQLYLYSSHLLNLRRQNKMTTNNSKSNNSNNVTNYNFYYDESDRAKLADSLLDLFVHAFIKTELDNMTNQRSNDTLNYNKVKE